MNKSDIAKLPRRTWPKVNLDEGAKFYKTKPEKHLAPGLIRNEARGPVSPLGGLMKEPKKRGH